MVIISGATNELLPGENNKFSNCIELYDDDDGDDDNDGDVNDDDDEDVPLTVTFFCHVLTSQTP